MNTPVGYIISWRVPATVRVDDLRKALKNAGVTDPFELAPDLKPNQVVARSAGFIAKLTTEKDARKLARPIGHAARQITREEVGGASDLLYTREAGIEFNEQTQSIECDDPTIAAMLPETIKTVHETRTASDVTRIVQKLVEDAGSDLIPVREQGGAYFVPDGHRVIGRVGIFLASVGGALSKFACTLGHGSDESIANTITDYLLNQIEELKESVAELNEKGVRSDVKARRLNRVAELRDRLRAYTSLLGMQQSRLETELNTAEATLLARLGPDREETLPATPAPADAPVAAAA